MATKQTPTTTMQKRALLRNPFLSRSLFFNDWDWEPDFWESEQRGSGVTMYEEGNKLFIEAEIPGLRSDDIQLAYNKGTLNIRAEQREEKSDENKRFFSRSTRSFAYSVNLPVPVNENAEPEATYKDGLLTISFDKAQKESVRKIQVKKG